MNFLIENMKLFAIAAALVIIVIKAYMQSESWQDKIRLTITLTIAVFFISLVLFTKNTWEHSTMASSNVIYQFAIMPLLILDYLVGSILLISFMSYKKGGLNNVTKPSENGLIYGFGIFALIFWLTFGSISKLIYESAEFLVFGLAAWLTLGLIIGVIITWKEERKEKSS